MTTIIKKNSPVNGWDKTQKYAISYYKYNLETDELVEDSYKTEEVTIKDSDEFLDIVRDMQAFNSRAKILSKNLGNPYYTIKKLIVL